MDPAQTTVLSLASELLQRILQQLSLKERLGSAALVHSTWHLAAIAATTNINLTIPSHPIRSRQQLDSLSGWLQRYGAKAPQSLALAAPVNEFPGPSVKDLLCSTALRDAKLTGIRLQLTPDQAGQEQGALQSLPASCCTLNSLELHSCHVLNPAASMATLAAMTSLQRLCLVACGGPVVVIPRLFYKLYQLTSLQLEVPLVRADSFKQLTRLTRLRDFCLDYPIEQVVNPTVNATAPALLTLTPALAQLASLQHLALRQCQCDPAKLSPLLQLQSLDLSGTRCSNTAALLGWVSQLQHLTSLNVQGCLQLGGDTEQAPLTAYAALTASSALERLAFSPNDLPAGAWRHMFPARRVLPRLSILRAWTWCPPYRHRNGTKETARQHRCTRVDSPPLASGDMLRLAQCCPQLQQLQLGTAVVQEPGKALACDCAALAGLTALQELELSLLYHGDQAQADPEVAVPWYQLLHAVLHSKAPTGAAPDVWLQLQDLCAHPQHSTKTWDGSKWI